MTTLADLRAIALIVAERTKQDAKWGEQNHPDGTGPRGRILDALALPSRHNSNRMLAQEATADTDAAAQAGRVTWQHILTEEWAEAMAEEPSTPGLTEEVVQVAAVGVSWLGAIERRQDARPVRVYISGPIASDPDAREAFAAAQAQIDSWGGYEAVNPFDIAPLSHPGVPCGEGYHPGDGAHEHTSSACYMRTDLLALLSCDAIHMLPGHENSKGATVELAVAKACGMPVSYAAEAVAS